MDEVVPDPMTDGRILTNMGTDAQKWAQEWCRIAEAIEERAESGIYVIDQGWMIGWFANAIEAGRNAGYRLLKEESQAAKTQPGRPRPDTSVVGERWRKDLNRSLVLLYPHARKYLSLELIDEVIREELERHIASRDLNAESSGNRRQRQMNDFEDEV